MTLRLSLIINLFYLPANMDMTDMRIVSTVWIGSHLSDAFSYPNLREDRVIN